MKTRIVVLLALVFALSLMPHPSPIHAAESGGTLQLGYDEPGTLDPAFLSFAEEIGIGSQVMEGLTKLDQNLQVVPAIATSWSTPDSKTWTFQLRHDVKFHNGRQVHASDFVYSWDRAKNGGGNYSGVFEKIDSFSAQGNYTFIVNLVNPDSGFPIEATLGTYWVIPQEAVANLATHPIGTGPFKFSKWAHGKKIILKANKDYYEQAPYLKGVQYHFYSSPDQEWAAFQNGQLDITRIPPSQWAAYKNDPNTVSKSILYTRGVAFNPTIYTDIRVRKAFQRAIDRAAIAANPEIWAYSPGLKLARGVVSPVKGSYKNKDIKIKYKPSQALSLLAGAGWSDTNGDHVLDNGAGTKLSIVLPDSASPAFHAYYQSIANDLADIGDTGVGAQVSMSTNLASQTVIGIGWVSDWPDPENDLAPYETGGLYATRFAYSSAAFDNYLKTGRAMADSAARNAAFHSADAQLVLNDAVVLPIAYGAMIPILKKPRVNDFVVTNLGYETTTLKNVWLAQ